MKTCRQCGSEFEGRSSLQIVCSLKCAIRYARKGRKLSKRKQREHLMTRRDWLKRAQKAFNAWVRLRDANLPCVSCGTYTAAQWQAGHYRTTKACPELRFEPLNCWKQCSQCNLWDSGNLTEYRINLVKRIGPEMVGWIEGPHELVRLTVDDIRAIESKYKLLAKALQHPVKVAA